MRLILNTKAERLNILNYIDVAKWLFDYINVLVFEPDNRENTLIMASKKVLSVHTESQVRKYVGLDGDCILRLLIVLIVVGLNRSIHPPHRHHETHVDQVICRDKG